MAGLRSTLLSFAIMVLIWAAVFRSMTFAAVFLILLGIHEMGHYVIARAIGMMVSTPVFTPLGAMIGMKELPANAYDEALMAFGGPFIGTAGAIAALLIGLLFQIEAVETAARAALFLNLFNLIPLSPLDGGRISMAIDRQLWPIGASLMMIVFALSPVNLAGVAILLLLTYWAWQDIKARSTQAASDPDYFCVPVNRRIVASCAYVSLCAFLMFTLAVTSPTSVTAAHWQIPDQKPVI